MAMSKIPDTASFYAEKTPSTAYGWIESCALPESYDRKFSKPGELTGGTIGGMNNQLYQQHQSADSQADGDGNKHDGQHDRDCNRNIV